jgi:hypothetical protein
MYVYSNIEARSCNNCKEKAISITYSKCAFVALGIQHTLGKHYFRFKHITAERLALLLLILRAALSNLVRLRGWVGFPQSIFRSVGHVARMGRGEMHARFC